MCEYGKLVVRLRASALDKDNFPRMNTERGASVGTCIEAAAAIEALVAQVDGENRFSVWANNPRTVALMKRCAEYERQVNELREAARAALEEKS